jgi:hypothetical protein
MNKDLVIVGCNDAEKVRFAAHLLEGPAAKGWDTYQISVGGISSCTYLLWGDELEKEGVS